MIEAVFGPEFFHVKQVIDVQFGCFLVPAKRKCLRCYVFDNVISFVKVFDYFDELNPNHARIFDSHFFSRTIGFHSIVKSQTGLI